MKILNKRFFINLILVISFLNTIECKGQEVSNFTITSVDSVEYTLYDYLDAGIPVVLDMFSRY